MAYDERLAERVRVALKGIRGLSERRMMGGLCFLLNGNMCCGVDKSDLFVRIGRARAEIALGRKYAMPFRGPGNRPVAGFVRVRAEGLKDARSLQSWLRPAVAWARSLPTKKKPVQRRATR